jgi:hypothetical protein
MKRYVLGIKVKNGNIITEGNAIIEAENPDDMLLMVKHINSKLTNKRINQIFKVDTVELDQVEIPSLKGVIPSK